MKKFSFVTTNAHKVSEARALLRGIAQVEQVDMTYPELQDELEVVASFGAGFSAATLRREVMVEDSGIFIDALGGFPGPYSSYVFKKVGNEGILKLMLGVKKRDAVFKSAVAFCRPDSAPIIFTGMVRGKIAKELRGSGGFGYDPIFLYKGRTFGEVSAADKNAVSHRGKALRKFAKWAVKNYKTV